MLKIRAFAEQTELNKILKKLAKDVVEDLSFNDVRSTIDASYIKLCYNASCNAEQYSEVGQQVLKVTKSMKEWSCTVQHDHRETMYITFTTKLYK